MPDVESTPLLRPSQTPRDASPAAEGRHEVLPGPGTRQPRRSRRWNGIAVAGGIMFAAAGVGLVLIFNTIQQTTSPERNFSPSEMMEKTDTTDKLRASGNHANGVHPLSTDPVRQRSIDNEEGAEPGEHYRPGDGDGHFGRASLTSSLGFSQTSDDSGHDAGDDATSSSGESSQKNKPNVFFIMIDDLGWNDIGYQSTDMGAITPRMDAMAASGIKLTNYYTMSICTPARASLMTGRYVVRYGFQYNVIQPGAEWALPLSEKILPEYFNSAGYESHMVGKWHLGSYMHKYTPHRRGFKTFLGYLNDEEEYWTHQSWTATLDGHKFFDWGYGNSTGYYDIIPREAIEEVHEEHNDDDYKMVISDDDSYSWSENKTIKTGLYSTTMFTNRALEIIGHKSPYDEHPLFLYLAHQAVHEPLGLPPDDVFTEEDMALIKAIDPKNGHRIKFAKVLMYLDKQIGDLVDNLEENGWLENSIIIVASDNGGCPSHGGSNYPLRGIKHSYWEGGTKVPAFIYSPSHIPSELWGTVYEGLMHVTDWVPTLASAVGYELGGGGGNYDGRDHWSALMTTTGVSSYSVRSEMLYNWDPYMLWTDEEDSLGDAEYSLPQGAFRKGKWKLLTNVWCSGYYVYNMNITVLQDPLLDESLVCGDMMSCDDCGQSCTTHEYAFADFLYNLEEDPREEHNLILAMPELAEELRDRARYVAMEEWKETLFTAVCYISYYVWAQHNYWMVPWYSLAKELSKPLTSTSTNSSQLYSTSSLTSSWTESRRNATHTTPGPAPVRPDVYPRAATAHPTPAQEMPDPRMQTAHPTASHHDMPNPFVHTAHPTASHHGVEPFIPSAHPTTDHYNDDQIRTEAPLVPHARQPTYERAPVDGRPGRVTVTNRKSGFV